MALKTPLPDEVFQQWLKSKPAGEIEKVFGRKPADISPMEVVGKEINKSPALFFRSKVQVSLPKAKDSDKQYSYKQLEKEKFYHFKTKISKEDWKENDVTVYLYDQIKEVKCGKCSGHGASGCKNCNGSGKVSCDKCKDEKKLRCNSCKGESKIIVKVDIYDEKGKIETVERKVPCGDCHGKGKLNCENCGGVKTVVCNKCKGNGGSTCKNCEGTGINYLFPLSPVPIVGGEEFYFFWNEQIGKEMSKSKMLKGKELEEMLIAKNVEPIRINSLKDLDKKNIEEPLGFWDKDASKQINECKSIFEKKQKSNDEEPKFPIEIYPLQKIDIETYKNKKFSIYSIGSQGGFVVFDLGF
ncbi:MAG: hypothetical protein OEY49_20440 [Candidatus Heimdallarchaeota archaeon]|nr:hypothetical protein [Candidatus Heimdallarchaeota archaeon]